MSEQAAIPFDTAGVAHCLHSELLDLRRLGRLQIRRATGIEFNADTQLWEQCRRDLRLRDSRAVSGACRTRSDHCPGPPHGGS